MKIVDILKRNLFPKLFAGLLFVGAAVNIGADVQDDFPPAQEEQHIDKQRDFDPNTTEALFEAGLGSLILLLQKLADKSGKKDFVTRDLSVRAPLEIGTNYSDNELTGIFKKYENDLKELAMHELDDALRPTITIKRLTMKVRDGNLHVDVRVRMLEVPDTVLRGIYENTIKKLFKDITDEKANDINGKFMESFAGNQDVGQIVKAAFDDEMKMMMEGKKMLARIFGKNRP